MRAYQTIRFEEFADVGSIRSEGRKSSVGRIPRGDTFRFHPRGEGTVIRNDRGYCKSASKASTRRIMKRRDRARSLRFTLRAEAE